jgi:soluble lytic murein transglycosylase-like protein
MAGPISKKLLTFLVILVGGGLLIAAAAPRALAPAGAVACGPTEAAEVPAVAHEIAPDPGQQALSEYVSRRYFVAATITERMVAAAYRAAAEVGLDPLTVLAVIAVESRFNPIAESNMGAKGLMQIIPRFHLDKLHAAGGVDAVFDPEANIMVGARILQEYVYRGGTLEAGLQQYNGASRDANAYYSQRVMAERERLEQAMRARGLTLVVASGQGS